MDEPVPAPSTGAAHGVAPAPGGRTDPIKVLIVDDHPLFAEALAARLETEPGLEILPTASDSGRALATLATEHPTVVVVDVRLGGESGIELIDRLREADPRVRVVMLTAVGDVDEVVDAVRRGARGWLPKSEGVDRVVRTIRGVVRGEAWIPPALLGGVLDRLTAGPPESDPLGGLTEREREVLQCMVDGLPRSEIAQRLFVSANTVRTHTQNLLGKLGCHSGLEAVSLALRLGMRPTGT